jgi:uncharacterized membrane protein
MNPSTWLDLGSLIAGVVLGVVGTVGGLKLRGKAPPRGDALRK